MEIWRNSIAFLISILLTVNPMYQTKVDVQKRFVRLQDDLIQPISDNLTEFKNPNSSSEKQDDSEDRPEILMQRTSDLLSDAVHMLYNIKNKSARRWLETFISKIGDLTTEMEATRAPLLPSEIDYMPPSSSSPWTSTHSNRLETSAEFSNVIPVNDDDTVNGQAVTKPGIPFFETDELVNQLHDQRNMKRQLISNHEKMMSELNRRTVPSSVMATHISNNQMPEESGITEQGSNTQDAHNNNVHLTEPSFDKKKESSAKGKEETAKYEDKLDLLRKTEIVPKHVLHTSSPFASKVYNLPESYAKEKELLNKNGFRKVNVFGPTREEWLMSHMYQRRSPHHTIHRQQNHYQNTPLKRYLSFGYTMIPFQPRKRSSLRPQRSQYAHFDHGGNPRLLKSINAHLRYPTLQQAPLVHHDQLLLQQKHAIHGKPIPIETNAVRNLSNTTHLDFNQFEQLRNSSARHLPPISKATKRFQAELRRSDIPNFNKRFLTSKYTPYHGNMPPRMLRKQTRTNSVPFGYSLARNKFKHVSPELTDIERQLRAGKVVILSDSLVRTNFDKRSKKSGKNSTNSD